MTHVLKILSIAFLLIPSMSYAQTNDGNNTLFLTYISRNTDYTAELNRQAKKLFKLSAPSCEAPETTKRLKPTVIEDPRLSYPKNPSDINHPSHGQWIERIQLAGCGLTIQHNFLTTAYNSNALPVMSPLLNGQSRIQPIDQQRAEDAVKKSIRSSGCSQSTFVLGAKFLGYKAKNQLAITDTNQNSGRFEEWIVDACNAHKTVNVAILPDSKIRVRFIARVKE